MQRQAKATDRNQLISQFLSENNLGKAKREKLSGDASFRSYDRIKDGDKTYVLMNAPPPQEDVRPFIKIANYLVKNGFSTPEIIASDVENGLLVLEDFGDNLYFTAVEKSKALEKELYLEAIKLLSDLRKAPVDKDIPYYSDEILQMEAGLLTEWYLPHVAKIEISDNKKKEYRDLWQELILLTRNNNDVTVLRDYHASNLIWMPDRKGTKRVGLLDFQDALTGSPAYDLVSLLEDARRDVDSALAENMIKEYLKINKNLNQKEFLDSYDILGTQRNLKIVGIFARLSVRDNKHSYLKLIPRVWKYIERDLSNPLLKDMKAWLDSVVSQELRNKIQ